MVKVLVDHYAYKEYYHSEYIDGKHHYLDRPLHIASKNGDAEIVKYLLENGADIKAISAGDSLTALHLAVKSRDHQTVKILLELGADPNVQSLPSHGQLTPLHIAVKEGAIKIVELLLEHGASIQLINADGESPLDLAKKYQYEQIIKTLMEFGRS